MSQAAYSRFEETHVSFLTKDAARSVAAHDSLSVLQKHQEPTLSGGRFMKPIVFGGLDGISTIFSLIAGSVGAQLSPSNMLAVGAANLVAGAFGMGMGEYVSSKADNEVARREQAREAWEVDNYPEGEIAEMIEIYTSKGISSDDASVIARTLAKYKDFWVEHMLLTEIGMLPPDDQESHVLSGLIMFCAFVCFGAIPLLSFAFLAHFQSLLSPFVCSAATSLLTLFLLGAAKAHFIGSPRIYGGMLMILQGSLCAASAYWLGDFILGVLQD